MLNGSRLQHNLAVKNEIFSSADRAFYKNGLYFKYGTARAYGFFRGKTENFTVVLYDSNTFRFCDS
jgi:hypothetical protein